jgi:hypothetical protein
MRAPEGAAAVAAAVAILVALGASCTRAPENPEDEIRTFLRRAEQAARDKDLAAFKLLIADDYRDAEGRDRRQLVAFVGYQFMREGSVHVAARLKKASFPGADTARVEVLAALGRANFDWTSLLDLDADIHFVDLDLRRDDGEWHATRAAWRPATAEDL